MHIRYMQCANDNLTQIISKRHVTAISTTFRRKEMFNEAHSVLLCHIAIIHDYFVPHSNVACWTYGVYNVTPEMQLFSVAVSKGASLIVRPNE